MPVEFFLNEFAVPAQSLAEHGYEIIIATPTGEVPPVDKDSINKRFFGGDETALQSAQEFFEAVNYRHL